MIFWLFKIYNVLRVYGTHAVVVVLCAYIRQIIIVVVISRCSLRSHGTVKIVAVSFNPPNKITTVMFFSLPPSLSLHTIHIYILFTICTQSVVPTIINYDLRMSFDHSIYIWICICVHHVRQPRHLHVVPSHRNRIKPYMKCRFFFFFAIACSISISRSW